MSYSYLGQKTLVYDDWTKMIFGPDRFGYPKFFNESIFLNGGLKIPLKSIKKYSHICPFKQYLISCCLNIAKIAIKTFFPLLNSTGSFKMK